MINIESDPIDLDTILKAFKELASNININDDRQKLEDDVVVLCQTFRAIKVTGYEDGVREAYQEVCEKLADTICDSRFDFDRHFCFKMQEYGNVFSNLVASCDLKNTDKYIERLRNDDQKHSIYKRLFLTSSRNKQEYIKEVADHYHTDIPLYNNWASNLFQIISCGLLNMHVRDNLIFLSDYIIANEFKWAAAIGDVYNHSAYTDNPLERRLKEHINDQCKQLFHPDFVPINNKTKRIGIFTENFFQGHSTHRTVAKYIHALADRYELILLHGERYRVLPLNVKSDERIFKEIHQISIFGTYDPFEMSIVGPQNLKLDILIYPDCACDALSLIMANMRLAPAQMAMTGMPTSTFNSEIDYFISGRDVECLEKIDDNYNERVVCLPGLGAIHTRHTPIKEFTKPEPKDDILIGGSWVCPKTHHFMASALGEALNKVNKKCTLRVFAGLAWFTANRVYVPYIDELGKYFNDNITLSIIEGAEGHKYNDLMAEVDLAVDSYPWGGSNTVSDCIQLNKPVVVWQGDKWYNRIGPAMLRRIGLESLIAKNRTEYIDKTIRLVEDDAWRIGLSELISEHNKSGLVDSEIYNSQKGVEAFSTFIDNVINGNIQPGKEPLLL